MNFADLANKVSTYRPFELSQEFQPENLDYQFVMAEDCAYIPDSWNLDSLHGWYLGVHTSLPVYQLRCKECINVGWLIGFPIHQDSIIQSSVIELNCELSGVDYEIDNLCHDFTGSFAVIVITCNSQKIFLDAVGSLSAIFSAQDRIVASSSAFVPYGDLTEDNDELIQLFGIPGKNNWFPLGLTPRNGVRRLLPNHSLDLCSFTTARNWPKVDISPAINTDDVVAEVSDILKNFIGAVTKEFRPWFSLTAGKDSRALLACAFGIRDKINFFTIDFKEPSSALDCAISQELATQFGLRHRVLTYEDPSDRDLREWMYRIGCCANAVRGWYWQSAFSKLGTEQPYISGLGAEVSNGYLWESTDSSISEFSPEDIVERLSVPSSSLVLEAAKEWLDSVSDFNSYTVLDLLFIEIRLGCWASVVNTYANPQAGKFRLFGFAGRRLYELFLSLPPEYKRLRQLQFDLIKLNCPDLMELPFNLPNALVSRTIIKIKIKIKDKIKASKLYAITAKKLRGRFAGR